MGCTYSDQEKGAGDKLFVNIVAQQTFLRVLAKPIAVNYVFLNLFEYK